MEGHKLGNSGLETGPLIFGGNVFGWTVDEQTSFRLLDAFVDAGFSMIDTADMYSTWVPGHKGGESEAIIGKWQKTTGKRSKVLIATKVGMELGPDKKGLSKAYIKRAADDSLTRLHTDYIDLYQSHTDDKDTPLQETLEAYQELIEQGKVRAIGASNYSGERLEEALRVSKEHGLPRYECLQPCYNLYEREEYERDLEPVCKANGLGVIPYFPLASGFLTGKYRSESDLSKSPRGGGIKKYLNDRGFRILEALDEVAKRYDANPARIALAWAAARPSVTAPIASATSVDQLNDLAEATRLTLDSAAIQLLNEASA
jgi:aryl-alcohol dehydrogenase-like predicted oxidoreductase